MVRSLEKTISIGTLVVVTAGAAGLAWWLGMQPDARIEQLLRASGVLELMAGGSDDERNELKPPLVVQAEAFALYLDPPDPSRNAAPAAPARPAQVEPIPATPALRLVGISYHRSDPAQSRALVCEPDGGLRWVREGTRLGRLAVEKINEGSMRCYDGRGRQEMTIESEPVPTAVVQPTAGPVSPGGAHQTTAVAKENAPASSGKARWPGMPARGASVAQADSARGYAHGSRPAPSRRPPLLRSMATKE